MKKYLLRHRMYVALSIGWGVGSVLSATPIASIVTYIALVILSAVVAVEIGDA